jgi:hypothetical protein
VAYGYGGGSSANWSGAAGQPSQAEPVFFHDGQAFVSRSRVVLMGVTYPVNGITRVYSIKDPKSVATLVLGILAIMCSFLLLVAALGQSGNGGAYVFLSLVGGSVGAALIAIYIWVQKDRFVLVLGTAGQDVHASWAYSASYILGLLNAINNALASRY